MGIYDGYGILTGDTPIVWQTASILEKITGVPASFWLNREIHYQRERYEICIELMKMQSELISVLESLRQKTKTKSKKNGNTRKR